MPTEWEDVETDFLWFDIQQFAFQSFKQGKIGQSDFDSLQQTITGKAKRFFTDSSLKCFVAFVSGKDENGKVRYKVDSNHNLDFSDDEAKHPTRNTAALVERYPDDGIEIIEYETVRNNEIVKLKTSVVVDHHGEGLLVNISQHAFGELNGKKLFVNSAGFASSSFEYAKLLHKHQRNGVSYLEEIFQGQHFTSAGNTYHLLGVDINRQVLKLKKVKEDSLVYGSQIGLYAPLFEATDINNRKVSLESFRGKHLLIDFWKTDDFGLLSHLRYVDKAFFATDRSKINFMDFVQADQTALDQLPESIAKYAIEGWSQMVVNDKEELIRAYELYDSPANYLLDKEGKIILRDIEAEDLARVLFDLTR